MLALARGQQNADDERRHPLHARLVSRPRILVADDEPLVLKTIERLLGAEYALTSVNDGAKALALLRAGERYDVVLCDLSMPEVGGALVYFETALLAPEQARRFGFIFGGTTTHTDRQLLDGLDQPRLEKPFTSRELRGMIETILADAERPMA